MENKEEHPFSEDKAIILDVLHIMGLFKGEFDKDMIKKHGYVKLDIDDVVTCKDPDDGKLIVGFECWYRYDYFEDAIKILRTFDVDDEDIEIYIPKKEYPMLIQANKKNIYLGIAPRVSYGDKPRFLLKEEKIK